MKFLTELSSGQSYRELTAPTAFVGGCCLLILQALNLIFLGVRSPGPLFSDLLQLGIENASAAEQACNAGLKVIEDS